MSRQEIIIYWYQDILGHKQDLEDIKVNKYTLITILFTLRRFGGHTISPYTVGEHCLLVHDLVKLDDDSLALAALLHDAYTGLGDVCTNTKRWLKDKMGCDLHVLERMVDKNIGQHFGFDPSLMEHPTIKAADGKALQLEVKHFFRKPLPEWGDLDVHDFYVDWMTLNSSRYWKLLNEYVSA